MVAFECPACGCTRIGIVERRSETRRFNIGVCGDIVPNQDRVQHRRLDLECLSCGMEWRPPDVDTADLLDVAVAQWWRGIDGLAGGA